MGSEKTENRDFGKMKLSVGILAALAGVNDAAVTCDAAAPTVGLFDARCDHTGFKITVNENCRSKHFAGIDFPNSFIWGVQATTKMATPGGTAPADVDAATTVTTCAIKPTAVDITDDAADSYDAYTLLGYTATTKSWQWTAGLTDCGITKQTTTAADANGVIYDYYDLYLNSASVSNSVQLAQMGQIKFTCKLYPWQEDNGIVDITDDTMVDDTTFKLRLWEKLQLKVKYVDAEDANTMTAMAATDITAPTQITATAASKLTYADYTAGTAVKLGSHMALELAEIAAGDMALIEAVFDVTLNTCWASSLESTTTTGTGDANAIFDAAPNVEWDDTYTASNAAAGNQVFKLWDEFFPAHQWVSPEPSNGPIAAATAGSYLGEVWDHSASSIKEIHFRQFAFNHDATFKTDWVANPTSKAKVFYHCLVKVCEKATPPVCSNFKMDATTATTCTAPATFIPTRRRRAEDAQSQATTGAVMDSIKVEVNGLDKADCDGNICVAKQANSADSGSKCAAASAGLAFLAALNL